MTTTTGKGGRAPRDVKDTARDLLQRGYHDGAELRSELRHEAPLLLCHALRTAGVLRWQLEAFSLAVRDAGDVSGFEPEAAVDGKQRAALQSIQQEVSLPSPLRDLLGVALPTLQKKQDLYAFYGILRGTAEKWDAVESVLELARKDTKP